MKQIRYNFLSRSYKTSSSTLTTEERSSGVVSPPSDQSPIVFRWRLKGRGSSFVRICCVCSVCCPSFSCPSFKKDTKYIKIPQTRAAKVSQTTERLATPLNALCWNPTWQQTFFKAFFGFGVVLLHLNTHVTIIHTTRFTCANSTKDDRTSAI